MIEYYSYDKVQLVMTWQLADLLIPHQTESPKGDQRNLTIGQGRYQNYCCCLVDHILSITMWYYYWACLINIHWHIHAFYVMYVEPTITLLTLQAILAPFGSFFTYHHTQVLDGAGSWINFSIPSTRYSSMTTIWEEAFLMYNQFMSSILKPAQLSVHSLTSWIAIDWVLYRWKIQE